MERSFLIVLHAEQDSIAPRHPSTLSAALLGPTAARQEDLLPQIVSHAAWVPTLRP